jgi:hypothetical protein
MHPSMSQAISQQRQADIARRAERHVRLYGDLPAPRGRSWDTRLGWALIRVGLRLLGDDARGATVTVATAGSPGC